MRRAGNERVNADGGKVEAETTEGCPNRELLWPRIINAANTHPETYPKFQQQLGRVVPLRDMINWCLQHPLEGKPLALDDPRMVAIEAYVTSERQGVQLAPGKH